MASMKKQRAEDQNLAVEKTYGEKAYDFIFKSVINFWTTLAVSGLFVFWVKHSNKPLKMLGNKLPSDYHAQVRDWFAKQGVFKSLPGGSEVARVTADALTINLPGLATILPSAWIGAKFKTQIVEGLDKMHYGADAEKDPRIAERHRMIETEKKPTFLGAAGARVGGMASGVFVGYLIGAEKGKNIISRLGQNEKVLKHLPTAEVLQEFNGIDHYASNIGDNVGGFFTRLFPDASKALDKFFRGAGISWEPGHAPASGELYNRSTRDWGKWTAADVMYTIITSATIGPFVHMIGKLPGMSYRQKQPEAHQAQHAKDENTNTVNITYHVHTGSDERRADQPQHRISHARNEDRIVNLSQEAQLAQ